MTSGQMTFSTSISVILLIVYLQKNFQIIGAFTEYAGFVCWALWYRLLDHLLYPYRKVIRFALLRLGNSGFGLCNFALTPLRTVPIQS